MTGKFGTGFLATHLLLERVKVKAYLKDEDEPLNIYKYPFTIQGSENNVVIGEFSYSDIKVMKTVHNRNGCETVLYHVCVLIK